MGKRVATVEFIEESSPVKKYATFDYTVEKKEDEVTTSEDFSSDEDQESKEDQPEVVSKNVSVGATKGSSGSSESDSEEDIKKEMGVVITPKMPRNGSEDVLEKKFGSSKSSGSEYNSSDEENEQPELVSKNISTGTADRSFGSSESESEEDAEKETEVVIPPKMPENASRKGSGDVLEKKLGSSKSSGSEYNSSDEELEEQPEVVSNNVSVGATDRSSSSSESDSEEDVEKKMDVVITVKMAETASRNGSGDVLEKKLGSSKSSGSEYSSSDEESKEQQPEVVSKNVSVGATNRSSGSSESDSEDDVEKEMEVVVAPQMPQTASRNGSGDVLEKKLGPSKSPGSECNSSDEEKDNEIVDHKKDQGDDISDESDEEEIQRKKLKVRVDNDEEMVDAESPKTSSKAAIESSSKIATETPITPQAQKTGSKKLFVGNLSFSLEQEDLEEFFKDAGEIVNVHFATHRDGRFMGHAIVEFATEEAVPKALVKNGQDLMGKTVNLGLPHSKSPSTPQTGYADKSGGAGCGWKSNARGRFGSPGGRFSSGGQSGSRGGRSGSRGGRFPCGGWGRF